MELTQVEKAALLQRAVINSSLEELSRICDELGFVEMSAPALGLACRFRGLAVVKALVERGAVFDFPSTEEIEVRYHCHIGKKHAQYRENYRTNYSLYLLRSLRGWVKGACCLKGMKFVRSAKREDGTTLPFLADQERLAVLDYLIEKRTELSFCPEEMLYYAIFAKDMVLYEALKRHGITLLEKRIYAITEGVLADGYWFEFGAMTRDLADRDYIEVLQKLSVEVHGKPFRYTEKIYENMKNHFHDPDIFAFFLAHFHQKKMKKSQIMRELIDGNALDALAVAEKEGWLCTPQKRGEMIAYAMKKEKTEVLAWLLEVQNRTTDFEIEQKKAEKKILRELNEAPDSVAALKRLWSYRKEADGTLTITNYKGTAVEVTVPEKIGKGVVTSIGKAAFTGCISLKRLVIPGTVKEIGKDAFGVCQMLERVQISEGVEEIGEGAFARCPNLKKVYIPESVRRIRNKESGQYHYDVFEECPNLTVICPKGSRAEAYCREKGILYEGE